MARLPLLFGRAYLGRMSMDGEWGDYIALLGLINLLNVPVAVVSSLGEEGLHIINPPNYKEEEEADFRNIALIGHEAETITIALNQWTQQISSQR